MFPLMSDDLTLHAVDFAALAEDPEAFPEAVGLVVLRQFLEDELLRLLGDDSAGGVADGGAVDLIAEDEDEGERRAGGVRVHRLLREERLVELLEQQPQEFLELLLAL